MKILPKKTTNFSPKIILILVRLFLFTACKLSYYIKDFIYAFIIISSICHIISKFHLCVNHNFFCIKSSCSDRCEDPPKEKNQDPPKEKNQLFSEDSLDTGEIIFIHFMQIVSCKLSYYIKVFICLFIIISSICHIILKFSHMRLS